MAQKRKRKTTLAIKRASKQFGRAGVQIGKEVSSILAYGGRDLFGLPHEKPKCTLKKGWFE